MSLARIQVLMPKSGVAVPASITQFSFEYLESARRSNQLDPPTQVSPKAILDGLHQVWSEGVIYRPVWTRFQRRSDLASIRSVA